MKAGVDFTNSPLIRTGIFFFNDVNGVALPVTNDASIPLRVFQGGGEYDLIGIRKLKDFGGSRL